MSESKSEGRPPGVPVKPPERVWFRVHRLLGQHKSAGYRNRPNGLHVSQEVPALVTERVPRSDGGELVKVSYKLATEDGQWTTELLTHYVPAHLVRPELRWRRDPHEDSGLPH